MIEHAINAIRLLYLSVHHKQKPWRMNYANAEAIYRWLAHDEPLPDFMDAESLGHYMLEDLTDPGRLDTLNFSIKIRPLHGDPSWLIEMLPEDIFDALCQTIFPNGEMSLEKAKKRQIDRFMEPLEHLGLIERIHPLPNFRTHFWTTHNAIYAPVKTRRDREDAAATA